MATAAERVLRRIIAHHRAERAREDHNADYLRDIGFGFLALGHKDMSNYHDKRVKAVAVMIARLKPTRKRGGRS